MDSIEEFMSYQQQTTYNPEEDIHENLFLTQQYNTEKQQTQENKLLQSQTLITQAEENEQIRLKYDKQQKIGNILAYVCSIL